MFKITLAEVYEAISPLKELLEMPLPVATSYKVGKISRQVSEEFDAAQEAVENTRKKYYSDDSEPSPEELEKYKNEVAELLETSVEIDGDKIPLGVLGVIDVKPSVFYGLLWLFKE
jgi:hypothetical protein